MINRRAPRATASSISSPTPRVVACHGSSRPFVNTSPAAAAISITAVPSGNNAYPANTGSPSGPVTVAVIHRPAQAAANASAVPSPPSAIGRSRISASGQRTFNPHRIAAHAAGALNEPFHLSEATKILI